MLYTGSTHRARRSVKYQEVQNMSTPSSAKVPGSAEATAHKIVDETAEKVEEAKQETKSRFAALRNDDEVQEVMRDAKPFLTGVAIAVGMVVDPPMTASFVTLKAGRTIQKVVQERKAKAKASRSIDV